MVVTINDRGPFVGGRVIDLSAAAAGAINMKSAGVAPVSLAVLGRRTRSTSRASVTAADYGRRIPVMGARVGAAISDVDLYRLMNHMMRISKY